MFLSDKEIQALTGRKRITLQREWLTLRGWLHEVNAAGRPVVLRAYAESRLSGQRAGAISHASQQPNFAALKS